MKVQSILSNSNLSFGALKRNPLGMSEDTFDAIKTIPVVDTFSKKYDAVVSLIPFISKNDQKRVQLALDFSNIKPKNIFERLYNKFIEPPKHTRIVLKTRAVNEAEMYSELEKASTKRLFEIYNKY